MSSPPPAPPPEEFMLEGLDQDDGWIMVEDEFLAVAHTFTRHLHHAEYMRQKAIAKKQHPSVLTNVVRPTDPRLEMREETKQKKAGQAQSDAQRTALEKLFGKDKGGEGMAAPDDEDADDDEDDGALGKDPWVGTALHGLMTESRRPPIALSNAAGVRVRGTQSKAESAVGSVSGPTSQPSKKEHMAPTKLHRENVVLGEVPMAVDDSSTEDESDNLNALVVSKARAAAPQRPSENPSLPGGRLHTLPNRTTISVSPPREKSPPAAKTAGTSTTPNNEDSGTMDFDYMPRPSVLTGTTAQRMQERLAEERARKERADVAKKKQSDALNGIPTFLV
ncbi:MAG: hypothetical protein M1826_004448 [Phylliscum demangeonii]|nr:MAG: hypothetical protein M1826_004448 [Phylliscum demangeonii]